MVHVTVQLVLFGWVLIIVNVDWLNGSVNGIWILTLPNKDSEVIISANMTIDGVHFLTIWELISVGFDVWNQCEIFLSIWIIGF